MKFVITTLLLFSLIKSNAQIIQNAVLSSCANYSANASLSINATVGETFYSTLNSKEFILKQGFQQPEVLYGNFSGSIKYVNGNTISNVIVNMTGTLSSNRVTQNGSYSIQYLYPINNFTIRSSKNNDINKTNGITTLDMALIQSHILGKNKLNSPYKLIAADVNGDGKVTTLDIVYLKRLILGLDTTFSNTSTGEKRLWAFVDSSYQFPDTTNPFPFKDSISYTGLSANNTNQTFIGVKLGDVNWDWNPALARMPSKVFIKPKKIATVE